MKKQTFVSVLSVVSTSISLSACMPAGFVTQASSPDPTKSSSDVVSTERCAPDATDYLWDVTIYGFSMSGANFNIGYNGPITGPITSIAVGAEVDSGTLNLQMKMQKPYDTAFRSVNADQTVASGFNFSVDLGIVKLGLGSSGKDGQAALIKLTSKGFQKLVHNAATQLQQDPNGWSTHVTRALDTNRFIVPVGALAGLRYGDQFNVFKYQYEYNDVNAGCANGVLSGAKTTPAVSVATLVPLDIKDGYATMTIVGTPSQPIEVNDLLEIQQLSQSKPNEKRALKKSVRIVGLHQPNKISVVDGQGQSAGIDLTSYLQYQMPSIVSDSNYWLAN